MTNGQLVFTNHDQSSIEDKGGKKMSKAKKEQFGTEYQPSLNREGIIPLIFWDFFWLGK